MSQAIFPDTPSATFVLRFWRERAAGEMRWRGRIEHVQSGETAAFLELDTMLSFLQRFGVALEDKDQLAHREI